MYIFIQQDCRAVQLLQQVWSYHLTIYIFMWLHVPVIVTHRYKPERVGKFPLHVAQSV
jgi:hypothetical protein